MYPRTGSLRQGWACARSPSPACTPEITSSKALSHQGHDFLLGWVWTLQVSQAAAHRDRAVYQNKTAFSYECAFYLETALCGLTREEAPLPGSRGLCSKQLHLPRELLPYVSITGRLSCAPARLPHLPSSDSGIDNMLYSTLILQLRSWSWCIGILRIQLRGRLLPFIIPLNFYNHLFHVISPMNSYFREW